MRLLMSLSFMKVKHAGANLEVWDVGGQESMRPTWPSFVPNARVLVLVIDSSDRYAQLLFFFHVGVEGTNRICRTNRKPKLAILTSSQGTPTFGKSRTTEFARTQ